MACYDPNSNKSLFGISAVDGVSGCGGNNLLGISAMASVASSAPIRSAQVITSIDSASSAVSLVNSCLEGGGSHTSTHESRIRAAHAGRVQSQNTLSMAQAQKSAVDMATKYVGQMEKFKTVYLDPTSTHGTKSSSQAAFDTTKEALAEHIRKSSFNGTLLFGSHVQSLSAWGSFAIHKNEGVLDLFQDAMGFHGLDADVVKAELDNTTVGFHGFEELIVDKVGTKLYELWMKDDSVDAAIFFANSVFGFTLSKLTLIAKELAIHFS